MELKPDAEPEPEPDVDPPEINPLFVRGGIFLVETGVEFRLFVVTAMFHYT